jgi:hypothetical protein
MEELATRFFNLKKIRKMTFKRFGFNVQEKLDNPYLEGMIDKLTNTKKQGTMNISDLWPENRLQ